MHAWIYFVVAKTDCWVCSDRPVARCLDTRPQMQGLTGLDATDLLMVPAIVMSVCG